jgi:hypothetical protein
MYTFICGLFINFISNTECKALSDMQVMNLKRYGRIQLRNNLRYYHGIFSKILKITRIINQLFSECKAGITNATSVFCSS